MPTMGTTLINSTTMKTETLSKSRSHQSSILATDICLKAPSSGQDEIVGTTTTLRISPPTTSTSIFQEEHGVEDELDEGLLISDGYLDTFTNILFNCSYPIQQARRIIREEEDERFVETEWEKIEHQKITTNTRMASPATIDESYSIPFRTDGTQRASPYNDSGEEETMSMVIAETVSLLDRAMSLSISISVSQG